MKKTRFENRLASFAAEPDKCWDWPDAVTKTGYGSTLVHIDGVRFTSPHRAAYTLLVGAIPEGTELDHLCRNRRCMNPRHLEPVSHRENVLRGNGPAAKHAVLKLCKRGHELAPRTDKYGRPPWSHRYCPTCARASSRAANRRLRERNRDNPEWQERRREKKREYYHKDVERSRAVERASKSKPEIIARRRARDRANYHARKAAQRLSTNI